MAQLDIKPHPVADCFRLMNDDELAALAEDIRENGLRDPIVIGRINGAATEALVDGRNRLAACKIAGVEPRFETIHFENDEAVRAFVKSRSERRDLSKGERAMALAMLNPEPEKGGRGKTVPKRDGFSKQRLSDARTVLRYSPALAVAVRDGVTKLDVALATVMAERQSLTTAENKLARLRKEAPDLADLVADERMKLPEAIAALDEHGKSYSAKRKKKTKSKPAPALDLIIREPCLDCNSEEERWQRSLMNLAGDAIAMPAFWSREFGKWDQFTPTSDLIELAEQAAASWQQLVSDLRRRKGK